MYLMGFYKNYAHYQNILRFHLHQRNTLYIIQFSTIKYLFEHPCFCVYARFAFRFEKLKR